MLVYLFSFVLGSDRGWSYSNFLASTVEPYTGSKVPEYGVSVVSASRVLSMAQSLYFKFGILDPWDGVSWLQGCKLHKKRD